jgi:hypothetical protein
MFPLYPVLLAKLAVNSTARHHHDGMCAASIATRPTEALLLALLAV